MEQVAVLAGGWGALTPVVVPVVVYSHIVVDSCCHNDMFVDSCRHIDMVGNKQAADKHLAGNPLLAGRLNYRFRNETCRS